MGVNLEIPYELVDYGLQSDTTGALTFDRTAFTLDTADYDGTVTYYFETVATNTLDGVNRDIILVNGSGTTVATITTVANTTAVRQRVSFTPTAGSDTYKIKLVQTTNATALRLLAGRIIVAQTNCTKTRIQIPLSSEATANLSSGPGPIFSTASSSYSLLSNSFKSIIWTRTDSNYVTLAASNTWEFEGIISSDDNSSTATLGLLNKTQSDAEAKTVTTTSSSITLVSTKFTSSSNWNNAEDYYLAIKSTGGGTVNAYRAALYIRLDVVTTAEIYYRAGRFNDLTASSQDRRERILLDKTKWSNPHFYHESTGKRSSTGTTYNVALRDCGTDDSTNTGTTVTGSTITPTTSLARNRTSEISAANLTSSNRFIAEFNLSGTTPEIWSVANFIVIQSIVTVNTGSATDFGTYLEGFQKLIGKPNVVDLGTYTEGFQKKTGIFRPEFGTYTEGFIRNQGRPKVVDLGTYTEGFQRKVGITRPEYGTFTEGFAKGIGVTRPDFIAATDGGVGAGYQYCQSITVDHTKCGSSDTANFPLLVQGTYSFLKTVANGGFVTNTNGYDIAFYSDVGQTNKLNWETESYDPATGAVTYWVQIPNLSSSSDTVVYMFYGNSAISTDQSNKTGTWDSHYKLVSHLGDGTTFDLTDSTNQNNGTNNNMSPCPGIVRGGARGTGSVENYVYYGTNSSLALSTVTWECWVKTTTPGANYRGVLCKEGAWGLLLKNSVLVVFDWSQGADRSTGINLADSTWHHVMASMISGSTNDLKIYIDGQIKFTGTSTISVQNGVLELGDNGTGNGQPLAGDLDEARVSDNIRSVDYALASYNNGFNTSTFYSTAAVPLSGGISKRVNISISYPDIGVFIENTQVSVHSTRVFFSTQDFITTFDSSVVRIGRAAADLGKYTEGFTKLISKPNIVDLGTYTEGFTRKIGITRPEYGTFTEGVIRGQGIFRPEFGTFTEGFAQNTRVSLFRPDFVSTTEGFTRKIGITRPEFGTFTEGFTRKIGITRPEYTTSIDSLAQSTKVFFSRPDFVSTTEGFTMGMGIFTTDFVSTIEFIDAISSSFVISVTFSTQDFITATDKYTRLLGRSAADLGTYTEGLIKGLGLFRPDFYSVMDTGFDVTVAIGLSKSEYGTFTEGFTRNIGITRPEFGTFTEATDSNTLVSLFRPDLVTTIEGITQNISISAFRPDLVTSTEGFIRKIGITRPEYGVLTEALGQNRKVFLLKPDFGVFTDRYVRNIGITRPEFGTYKEGFSRLLARFLSDIPDIIDVTILRPAVSADVFEYDVVSTTDPAGLAIGRKVADKGVAYDRFVRLLSKTLFNSVTTIESFSRKAFISTFTSDLVTSTEGFTRGVKLKVSDISKIIEDGPARYLALLISRRDFVSIRDFRGRALFRTMADLLDIVEAPRPRSSSSLFFYDLNVALDLETNLAGAHFSISDKISITDSRSHLDLVSRLFFDSPKIIETYPHFLATHAAASELFLMADQYTRLIGRLNKDSEALNDVLSSSAAVSLTRIDQINTLTSLKLVVPISTTLLEFFNLGESFAGIPMRTLFTYDVATSNDLNLLRNIGRISMEDTDPGDFLQTFANISLKGFTDFVSTIEVPKGVSLRLHDESDSVSITDDYIKFGMGRFHTDRVYIPSDVLSTTIRYFLFLEFLEESIETYQLINQSMEVGNFQQEELTTVDFENTDLEEMVEYVRDTLK